MRKIIVYELGYLNMNWPLGALKEWLVERDAVLADIRFQPRSHNPKWAKHVLERVLGERYVHIEELGNLNYKLKGMENIEIADMEKGLSRLWDAPFQSVVIMCACKDFDHCHRKVVAARVVELGGEVRPLLDSPPSEPSDIQPILF
jgi:uncharacterized protein (DUF488 family)